MHKDLLMEKLKNKVQAEYSKNLEWFQSSVSATWIAIDWARGDVYIIDPQDAGFPQVEIAQIEDVDPLNRIMVSEEEY